ncbi:GNAT family N-acetyltransferase [Paraglaciecola hydrolytica]|uniref:GCN5 family acetyltransferase n=1 Tax=Paraglaciecola hydrolytica TaxID=1799789 RepID=A0A136A212_9ALTE|nr:GNAT family N-acetyltransferase [Paraglaciecola hydrolytica]KXI29288.1 GCN5 family acetyltransferase [Paraglaciecola hydrolytica]
MIIALDDLSSPAVAALLQQHLDDMYRTSPPESVHALDLSKLKAPDIKFWCAWQDNDLLGCGALKIHNPEQAEIKSMRTATQHLRKGVAASLLTHIINEAKLLGLTQLYLETGSQAFFNPAIQLYQGHGFDFCGPFASYTKDPNSKFMTLKLNDIVTAI